MQDTNEAPPAPEDIVDSAINGRQEAEEEPLRLCDMDESDFRERCVHTFTELEKRAAETRERLDHAVKKILTLEEKYERLDARLERLAVLIDKLQTSATSPLPFPEPTTPPLGVSGHQS